MTGESSVSPPGSLDCFARILCGSGKASRSEILMLMLMLVLQKKKGGEEVLACPPPFFLGLSVCLSVCLSFSLVCFLAFLPFVFCVRFCIRFCFCIYFCLLVMGSVGFGCPVVLEKLGVWGWNGLSVYWERGFHAQGCLGGQVFGEFPFLLSYGAWRLCVFFWL